MNIEPQQMEEIGRYVRAHVVEWLPEGMQTDSSMLYGRELLERAIRVEEELKHQREELKQQRDLMREGFERMDKRFEAMEERMDRRFEAMEERMDRRFEAMEERMDRRFEQERELTKEGFERVDRRLEASDKRFDILQKSIQTQTWTLITFIGVASAVVVALGKWMA